jgi:hypothetical protein
MGRKALLNIAIILALVINGHLIYQTASASSNRSLFNVNKQVKPMQSCYKWVSPHGEKSPVIIAPYTNTTGCYLNNYSYLNNCQISKCSPVTNCYRRYYKRGQPVRNVFRFIFRPFRRCR